MHRYHNGFSLGHPARAAATRNAAAVRELLGVGPVASGPKFATTDEVRAHLEVIAKLPLWRLDLVNNSAIVFDPAELKVTDATTRESFSFRGWGLGVAQLAASGHAPGAQEGVTNLTVRSEDPPTIGNWYKSNVG